MEILYKKEKEEADQLLEQQRLVSLVKLDNNGTHFLALNNIISCNVNHCLRQLCTE